MDELGEMIPESFCDYCEGMLKATAYRVISDDSGGLLLHIIECHDYHIQALELGLTTAEITLDQ